MEPNNFTKNMSAKKHHQHIIIIYILSAIELKYNTRLVKLLNLREVMSFIMLNILPSPENAMENDKMSSLQKRRFWTNKIVIS